MKKFVIVNFLEIPIFYQKKKFNSWKRCKKKSKIKI